MGFISGYVSGYFLSALFVLYLGMLKNSIFSKSDVNEIINNKKEIQIEKLYNSLIFLI